MFSMRRAAQVMVVGGTKQVYNVDIYSGNHPFYQGTKSNMIMDEGRVSARCCHCVCGGERALSTL